ncbi:MAG: DUF2934 domain-containing protein [Acidobacteria bacterium]|nr:DUF2934 domain-containing protein [Acidobacteriota bacterium]
MPGSRDRSRIIPAIGKEKSSTAKQARQRAEHSTPAVSSPQSIGTEFQHEEIARVAYALWEARCGAGGTAEQDWQSAIELLRARRSGDRSAKKYLAATA